MNLKIMNSLVINKKVIKMSNIFRPDSPRLWFAITSIACGFVILWPSLSYQPWFSSGDHGLNLYAASQTANGGIPYQDFQWWYGPLMIYYHAFFIKIFGDTLSSVLLANYLIRVTTVFFIYLILSKFIPQYLAVLASGWYAGYQPDFPHTYNHAGGVLFILISLWLFNQYAEKQRFVYLKIGSIAIVCLFLIKINIGLFAWASFWISTFLVDLSKGIEGKKSQILKKIKIIITTPLITIFLYLFFFKGLPLYYINQCLGLGGPYHQHPCSIQLGGLTKSCIFWLQKGPNLYGPVSRLTPDGVLFIPHIIALILFIIHKKFASENENKNCFLRALIIFYFIFNHEFILKGHYQIYTIYWSAPFFIIMAFLVIGIFLKYQSSFFRKTIYLLLTILIMLQTIGIYEMRNHIINLKNHRVLMKKLNICLLNDRRSWIDVAAQTTAYLKKNMKKNDSLLVLPYDSLYYYLLDLTSPIREQYFFQFNHMPIEQEMNIINLIRQKKVDWVLVSNRSMSNEPGLGNFGKSHNIKLANYIYNHYREENSFGLWNVTGGWASDHAIKIYRLRK